MSGNARSGSSFDPAIWIEERLDLLAPALVFLGALLVPPLLPGQLYWLSCFEPGRIYESWPWWVLLAGLGYSSAAFLLQRRHGRALLYPVLAAIVFLLFYGTALVATGWAADWSPRRCSAALPVLALAMGGLLAAVIAHAQLWRMLCDAAVVAKVRRALRSGRFLRHVEARRKRQRRGRPQWASHHCACIVEHHYERIRQTILRGLPGRPEARDLRQFLEVGESLAAYLALDWPDESPGDEARRRWAIAEALREVLTVALWARGGGEALERERVLRWLRDLREAIGHSHANYCELIDALANLALAAPDAHGVRAIVAGMVQRFREIVAAGAGGVPPARELAEISAVSWLALAPRHLTPQDCISVWLEMRRRQRAGPFVAAAAGAPEDAASICARARLAELYAAWAEGTPKPWREALDGRSRHARQLAERSQSRPASQPDPKTGRIPSWPYRYVWTTPRVLLLYLLSTAVLVAGLAQALGAVNPRVQWSWGWNSVDHLADRRPWNDYTASSIAAMARSQHWLALATDRKGLVLIDQASRVPREDVIPGPMLDVVRAGGVDEFMALAADQSLTLATLGRGGWPALSALLAAPKKAVWPGNAAGPLQLAASGIDARGWLMAVRGRGVARYLADELPGGRRRRWRSWQTGPLSAVALDQAVITRQGVWVTLQGGGIRFARKDDLSADPSRAAVTPPIERLEAGDDGSWALAADSSQGLWFYAASGGRWFGPFFSRSQAGSHLESAAEVSVAAVQDAVTWLGTRRGLFAYDTGLRRILPALPQSGVADLAALPAAPGQGRALGAGEGGLTLVEAPTPAGEVKATKLDPQPVSQMSVSADGQLCVYRARGPGPSGREEIRTLHAPFIGQTPSVLAPDMGWKNLPRPPLVAGVGHLGSLLLFATSEGAFLYSPDRRTYQDASLSSFGRDKGSGTAQEGVALRAFSSLKESSDGLLALADGNPQLLTQGSARWLSLDPERTTRPVQLLAAGGRILGLEPGGEILRYLPSHPVERWLAGRLTSMHEPVAGESLPGDLATTGDGWKAAWVADGRFATYDSATSELREQTLPVHRFAGRGLAQLRLAKEGPLFLLDDGRILQGGEPAGEFGSGECPFSPAAATALAPTRDGSVLLGGPGGHALRYDWRSGSWTSLGSGPLPDARPVVRLQETSAGTLALSAGGAVYRAEETAWTRLEGARRWAADRRGERFWLMSDDGLTRLGGPGGKGLGGHVFSTGSGMQSLVDGAAFAWQEGPATVAFFTPPATVSAYDARTDSWRQASLPVVDGTSQFVAGDGFRALLNRGSIFQLRRDWTLARLAVLPVGATGPTVHATGKTLRVAFLEGGRAVLWIWDELSPSRPPREFRQAEPDGALGVAFSSSGSVWALAPGRMESLEPVEGTALLARRGRPLPVPAEAVAIREIAGGGLRLHSRSGVPVELPASAAGLNRREGDERPLATLSLGGRVLEWHRQEGGGIRGIWRARTGDVPLHLWARAGGRLAIQSVRDVAIADKGQLLAATEAGLVVRNAESYLLQELHPEIQADLLIPSLATGKVLVLRGQQVLGEWRDGALVPPSGALDEVSGSLISGPWQWRPRLNPDRSTGILVAAGDGRRRTVLEVRPGRYRFADDVVRWIGRESGGRLWLETQGGNWQLGPRLLRGPATAGRPQRDEAMVEYGGIEVTAASGRVRFRALDGGPVFERGRLFVDNATRMGGDSDRLFLLVPGRCLLRREPGRPSIIAGSWRLPAGLPAQAPVALEATPNGVRLQARIDGDLRAWELDLRRQRGEWLAVPAQQELQATVGPIAWRRWPAGGSAVETVWSPGEGRPAQVLALWWSGDRFAWDRVRDAGPLDGRTVALVTPAGVVTVRAAGPAHDLESLWPIHGLELSTAARMHGKITGLALGGPGLPEYVLTRSGGKSLLAVWSAPGSPSERPTAVVGYRSDGRDRFLGILPEWEQVPVARAREAYRALRSALPELPEPLLIRGGQLAFDQARGGCPLGPRGKSWIGFTASDGAGCLLGRYELWAGTGGAPRLLLRDLWRSRLPIEAVRTGGPDRFLAFQGSAGAGGPPRVQGGRLVDGDLVWSAVPSAEAGRAFRHGERVTVDVTAMKWSTAPYPIWDRAPPLVVVPHGYPLFVSQPEGLALSFDVLTTLAFDRENRSLALGTRGGVFQSGPGWRGNLEFFRAAGGAPLIALDPQRLRFDDRGRLWGKLGQEGRAVTQLAGPPASAREGWPADRVRDRDKVLQLSPTGLRLPSGRLITKSNDAWGLDVHALSGIVEGQMDPQARVLWLATRNHGVFKILLDQVAP